MTTTTSQPWGTAATGDVRISDADRDRTVARLQEAYSEGRLDKDELDRRIDETLAARTQAELATALRGLPGGAAPGGSSGFSSSGAAVSQPAPAKSTALSSLDRSWAMAAHWLGFVSSFVGPGIVAATKGRHSRYIREQAMEAVNFQVTVIGMWIALGIVTGVTFGVAGFLMPVFGFIWMAVTGVAGLSAATGNSFRYPYILRLFR